MRLSVRRSPEKNGLTSRYTTAAIETAAIRSRPPSIRSLLSKGLSLATVVHLGAGQRVGETLGLAVVLGALPEAWAGNARRAMAANDLAMRILARDLVDDEVLQRDDIAFHAQHLGDVGDLARAVAQTGGLD